MLLGDVLARFDDEAAAAKTILGLGDLSLICRLREQADAAGQPLGAYAANAVRRYAAGASDEEWTTLMGLLARAEDPGVVCLQRAFSYVLKHPH